VLLCGPSGSGKSISYATLASAYQHIREVHALSKTSPNTVEWPVVDMKALNPGAYSSDEVS